MGEKDVREFWQAHPCGDGFVRLEDYREVSAFFDAYDANRYRMEAHIPACLDSLNLAGKRVLEIGFGQGAESEQMIRRGALWSGIDLTDTARERTTARLKVRGLSYERIMTGSALALPFPDASFDVVFSHGVLHHVPDIKTASAEIRRVLKQDGRLVIMMYARYSLNYMLSIAVVRRLGLLFLWFTGIKAGPMAELHLANARKQGLWRYLRLDNFVHANTDGPESPFARVYSRAEIAKDFPDFQITRTFKRFMHAPPLPVRWLPLEPLMGWHLWAILTPVAAR